MMTPLQSDFLRSRRSFLRKTLSTSVALLCTAAIPGCKQSRSGNSTDQGSSSDSSRPGKIGALETADVNGCRLPAGFRSRIVARSSQPVVGASSFVWHGAPDGGACFAHGAGWIYTSNSELENGAGGASAIEFDQFGHVAGAYPILANTSRNCAGGPTPWGTWLSCEEDGDRGRVFECDPTGIKPALERPALGYFNHEAAAYDPLEHVLYMTEDRADGGFYRFKPQSLTTEGFADLRSGRLEIAEIIDLHGGQSIVWHNVPDPSGRHQPTRYQVPESSPFNRGEGIAQHEARIFFCTTGDDRVWAYDIGDSSLECVYDGPARNIAPRLTGVDNITANSSGELLVAEDGGDMQIMLIDENGDLTSIVQLQGHESSEVTGVAFSPDYSRLYFSSQRGVTGHSEDGITFEIQGPF